MTNRRTLLMMLMLGAALPLATPALADKGSDRDGGDRDGGDRDGGDRDGGDRDSGKDSDGNSGNGNGNGGSGKGSDDGGSNDGGSDDGKDDDGDSGSNSGSGKGGKPSKPDDDKGQEDDGDDDDRIRAAVKRGEAAPLKAILDVVRQRYDGEIVKIKLVGKGKKMQYRIRLIDASNNLIEVRVNAANAVIVGSTEPGLY